jgi:hypothetical protein
MPPAWWGTQDGIMGVYERAAGGQSIDDILMGCSISPRAGASTRPDGRNSAGRYDCSASSHRRTPSASIAAVCTSLHSTASPAPAVVVRREPRAAKEGITQRSCHFRGRAQGVTSTKVSSAQSRFRYAAPSFLPFALPHPCTPHGVPAGTAAPSSTCNTCCCVSRTHSTTPRRLQFSAAPSSGFRGPSIASTHGRPLLL